MATDDWKHRAGGAPRPGRPAAAANKGRSRLAVAVFPLLVAAGVTVGLFFWLEGEPAPLFLSIPVSEYEAWPANPGARWDADGLKAFFPGDTGVVASQSQEQESGFEREVDELAKKAKRHPDQPVVVHLCALAVADGDAVYVLRSKAVPGRKETWLPLAKVLAAVDQIGGNRLLLLDLRPVEDPRLGQTGGELAKALDKELTAAKPTFLIGAQCAPAEYPYVSPELRRGVFAEFLRRGLDGHADGYNSGRDKDRKVSAVELVTYARARVVQWLKHHEVPIAAPTLYGNRDDFVLRSVRQGDLPWDDPQAAEASPPKVVEAWETVEKWRAAGAVHTAPRTFRELQETVGRIDRAAAGGGNPETLDLDLKVRLDRLSAQWAALQPTPYPVAAVGRYKPGAAAEAKAPDPKGKGPDLPTAIRQMREALSVASRTAALAGKATDPKEKEEEAKVQAKAKGDLAAAQKAFWTELPEPAPYHRTVAELFADLTQSDGTAQERGVESLAQYLATFRGLTPPPPHLELAYLAVVGNPNVANRRLWQTAAPTLARRLLAAAVAGEAAVAVNGRGMERITAELSVADKDFASALGALFVPDDSQWIAAEMKLAALPGTYRDLGRLAAAHAAAVWEWEEDVALLAVVGDFAHPTGTVVDDAFEVLRDRTAKLRQAIDGKARMDVLTGATEAAAPAREGLVAALRPATASPVEGRARLRLPLGRADERKQWTADADREALAKAKTALAVPGDPGAAGDVRKAMTDDAAVQAAAARRVARATALLGLVGEPPPDSPAGWRAALVDRLDDRYQKAPTAAGREPFAWLIHPAELPAAPVGGGARNDPATDLRQETDRAAARGLAANRYGPWAAEMGKVPAGVDRAVPNALAEELNQAAQRLTTWTAEP